MHTEVQNQTVKFTSKKAVIVTLTVFILIMLAVTAQLSYMILKYDKIYSGIYIDDLYVGSLTFQEAEDLLKSKYQDIVSTLEITLKCGKFSEKFKFSDVDVSFDISDTVSKAFSIGRTGNVLKRFSEIINARRQNIVLDINVSFDRKKVESIAQSLYDKTFINVKEADLLVQDDRVVVRSGHHGENIDKDQVFAEIENFINQRKGGIIDIPIIITYPGKINADDYLAQINRDPQNAYVKVENNQAIIIPEVFGRKINKYDLNAVLSQIEKNENTQMDVPIEFIEPKVKVKDVEEKLFKDTLYTAFSSFYTNTEINRNRSENIRLAASKVNGKILAPGEVFSFNETVGKRTVDAGYRDAYVYKAGKVVPDLGGGICQVSSTLYNAVLYSDLEVVERRNHQFVVTYVPYGTDATVFYGQTDFRFKNSTNWPIKIESWISKDNKLYFSLKGTIEEPGKKVEIKSEIKNTTDFKTKYIDDPNLPEGQTKVLQQGHKGYVIDTYKIIKMNDKVVSTEKISTSIYKPLDEEIARGTKKLTANPAAPGNNAAQTPTISDTDRQSQTNQQPQEHEEQSSQQQNVPGV